MSLVENLITDRTQSDVDAWRLLRAKGWNSMTDAERAKWLSGMKGAYNATDMNRVNEAMEYLVRLFDGTGVAVDYTPPDINGRQIWQLGDIPTEAQMALHLENLRKFWAAKEAVSISVLQEWNPGGFGYLDPGDAVQVGEIATALESHGLLELKVIFSGEPFTPLDVVGDAWSVVRSEDSLVATYHYPNGTYADVQDALGSLTLICPTLSEDMPIVEAQAEVRAVLRSKAEVSFGTCDICWSSVISWAAFERYGFTWEEIEATNMTWSDLESLPQP